MVPYPNSILSEVDKIEEGLQIMLTKTLSNNLTSEYDKNEKHLTK